MNINKFQRISVVIPIYLGEKTLLQLIEEIKPFANESITNFGIKYSINEVILVHDCGPDQSDKIIEELCDKYSFITPIWLSRNYGQHAASIAGMSSATGDWVVTIDEDGQQDPIYIANMLDVAISKSLQLVYAFPTNIPPHGWVRNLLSRFIKKITTKLLAIDMIEFNSYRMIDGEIARTLAAYCGNKVYLDVALNWIVSNVGHCPLELRRGSERPSGYSYYKLIRHFWNLILTSGTRPLRLITILGIFSLNIAILITFYALYWKFIKYNPVQGWASLLIVVSFFSGITLISIGVIAEYLAVTLGIVMGKPLYVVSSKPVRNLKR